MLLSLPTSYKTFTSLKHVNTANSVMNAQGFTFEQRTQIFRIYKAISPVFMGNFDIRCEVRTGCPSGDA